MAQLIRNNPAGREVHELLFHTTSIGRGGLNDILIEDPDEKRTHAEVVSLGRHRYAVRDLRSVGGVTVNGERVTELRPLGAGDVVRVGPAEFVFEPDPLEEPAAAPRPPSIGGGVLKLTVGTFAARVFGYVREMVECAYFGLGGIFDAYVAATSLPTLFRDVLGERVLESSFTPAHRALVSRGYAVAARRLTASLVTIVAVGSFGLTILGFLFAPWVVVAFVPGFVTAHPELVQLTLWLARGAMPFVVVIALSSLFGALLLSERRFVLYSVAPIGSSACMILAVVLFYRHWDAGALVMGLVAGGVVQMVLCGLPYLRRPEEQLGLERGPGVQWNQPALRKVGRTAVPIVLTGVLHWLSLMVDRALASIPALVKDTGRIGALYAAQRLLQLPFAIFGLSVGRAAFPALIDQATSEERGGFSRAVVRALRLNYFLLLPAAVGTMVLVTPLVALMFERGRFTAAHTRLTAIGLFWYAPGLVAMGACAILTRAFYALLETRIPFYLAILQVSTNIVLSTLLAMTPLQHGGLALATTIAFWTEIALLLVMLRRLLARQGRRLSLHGLWDGLGRMTIAGAVMAVATSGSLTVLSHHFARSRLLGKAALLGVPGVVGLAAYFVAAALLRCDEAHECLRLLRRRSAPRKP